MKFYEKVTFYALLPFVLIWRGAKKVGKSMILKFKPAVAVLMAVIMILAMAPLTSFAIAYDTYDISYRTQSGNNRSFIRYGLTDAAAGSFTVNDRTTEVELKLSLNDGWYLEKWDTWFNGAYDKAYATDPSYNESNPYLSGYTFANLDESGTQFEPLVNYMHNIDVNFVNVLYGDFRVDAVVRPILSVKADDGVTYQVSTDNPILVESGVVIEYGENASISYSVDQKHVVTDITANYGTQYSDNGTVVTVSSVVRPATVNIKSRLKQQKVNFNANGATGSMPQQVFEYGVEQPLSENGFTRKGYTFAGWNTAADGSGASYGDKALAAFEPTNDGESITLYAQWTKNIEYYTVNFNSNGGENIDPITVIGGEKYGRLPSSSVTGLSGGDSNWYLVDENGIVTDTKITRLSTVEQTRNHTLFVKRKVLSPGVSLSLSVPGGISDSYNYYIPDNSTRILKATVGNRNDDVLDYTYQWYKNDVLIENESKDTLTIPGNVSDAGVYKAVVTAKLKDGAGIVATEDTASGEKELTVKILRLANELKYDANGGEGGPSVNYTGGSTATVSADAPEREHYVFTGWNTKADGTGEEYTAGSAYTFENDGGNGGCVTTLYAQWKPETKTVTYMADGKVYKTEFVEYGKDAALPAVPAKEGYGGKWNHNGKGITEDTVITAIYTVNKYTVTYIADGETVETVTVEHGKDATAPAIPEKEGYTQTAPKWDNDGKNITADTVINAQYTVNKYTITFMDENGVYTTQTYKHGEKVSMPDVPAKEGYTVNWETVIDKATDNTTVNAVYTKNIATNDIQSSQTADDKNIVPDEIQSPQTADNTNLWLWASLALVSGGALFVLLALKKKEQKQEN